MTNDPIVQEVREARARLLEEAGGDRRALMDRLRQMESEHPHRLVTLDDVRSRQSQASPAPK